MISSPSAYFAAGPGNAVLIGAIATPFAVLIAPLSHSLFNDE